MQSSKRSGVRTLSSVLVALAVAGIFAGCGAPPRKPRPKDEQKSKPRYPALTDDQIAALEPESLIVVKRFHRTGRVVRVEPEKHVVLVSVGQLEVEIPYNGIALPTGDEHPSNEPRRGKPRPERKQPKTTTTKPTPPPTETPDSDAPPNETDGTPAGDA